MIKYFLICIFLCGLCLIKVKSQTFSENNQNSNAYELELLNLERAYFDLINYTDTTTSLIERQIQSNEIILQKVYCHKKNGKFEAANETALRLEMNNLPDSNQYKYRKELMFSFYILNKFEDAYNQIIQHKLITQDSAYINKLDFWEILTLSNLKKYEKADSLLANYSQKKNNIPFYFDKSNTYKNIKIYKAKKAKVLASIFPGAGMLYLGKTKEGLFSLALQAITLGWGIHNISNKYYASGFFTGFGLFQTFYFGGINRTEILVEELNKAQQLKITNKYLEALLALEK
jgi:hypothetical protein